MSTLINMKKHLDFIYHLWFYSRIRDDDDDADGGGGDDDYCY